MKLLSLTIFSAVAFVDAARYGLLRVSNANEKANQKHQRMEKIVANRRSLFDEEFSATLRELIGSDGDGLSFPLDAFSMSMSMSMPYTESPTIIKSDYPTTIAPTAADTVDTASDVDTTGPTDPAVESVDPTTTAPESDIPTEAQDETTILPQIETAGPTSVKEDFELEPSSSNKSAPGKASGKMNNKAANAAMAIGGLAVVAIAAALIARKMYVVPFKGSSEESISDVSGADLPPTPAKSISC